MPRVTVVRIGNSTKISLDPIGTFSFPRRVIERLGWEVPSRIKVEYLLDKQFQAAPLTIFFSIDEDGNGQGYALSPLYRKGVHHSGGKIRCARLAKQVLAPRVALPIFDLEPIYPATNLCDVVILATPPQWMKVDFTMSGAQSIPGDQLGVYIIYNDNGKPVKIGEGIISDRLQKHLKDDRFIRAGRGVRYFPVSTKEDSLTLEQVFIAQHETVYRSLPELNLIRA